MRLPIESASGRTLLVAVALGLVAAGAGLRAEDVYNAVPGWGQQLPNGMKWGETSGHGD